MKSIFLILCSVAVGWGSGSFAYDKAIAETGYKLGAEAFRTGDYPKAISAYEQALGSGISSGALHFNLGDAYFRNGQLGEAIFHFRKAAELLPRDPDIRYNLDYARKKTTDKIEDKGKLRFSAWVLPLNLEESLVGLAFASVFFWGAFLLSWFKDRAWIKPARNVALIFLIVSALQFLIRFRTDGNFGVVVAREADVYSGTGKDNVLLFTLHEGSEVKVDESQSDWTRVALPDGKRGWISAKNIKR